MEPEVKRELTLCEHICQSLMNEPIRWKFSNSYNYTHSNGTKIRRYSENYVTFGSEPYISFTSSEQETLSQALDAWCAWNAEYQTRVSTKRALARWNKPVKVTKPSK